MKRIAFAVALSIIGGSAALAADLPPPPPPPRAPAVYVPQVVPYFSWTGIYLGVNGGYTFGTSNWTDPTLLPPSTGNFNTNGWLFGGTLGGNYQIGSFVIGLEGDGDWTNITGTTTTNCGAGCTTSGTWLATVRGRAGFAWDRVLFYGTGGAAFGDIVAVAGALPSSSTTQTGWTAGGGVEWAFTPNWTAKVEYLYVNLGTQACPAASCGSPSNSVTLTENIVRAGINFKFW